MGWVGFISSRGKATIPESCVHDHGDGQCEHGKQVREDVQALSGCFIFQRRLKVCGHNWATRIRFVNVARGQGAITRMGL
jgi:hypothetical protein